MFSKNKSFKAHNRRSSGAKSLSSCYFSKSSVFLSKTINSLILILGFLLLFMCVNIIIQNNYLDNINQEIVAAKQINLEKNEQAISVSNTTNTETEKNGALFSAPCQGTITSRFGSRTISLSRGKSEFHYGLDISNSHGTEIHASQDGIVEFSGWQNGYGNVVIIKHNDTYKTIYGHNSRLLVKNGDKVKKGQVISLMGSTGRSTGTHVHFEIRVNDKPVDPLTIVKIK